MIDKGILLLKKHRKLSLSIWLVSPFAYIRTFIFNSVACPQSMTRQVLWTLFSIELLLLPMHLITFFEGN